jgi:nicotinamidase-related amidase
VESADVISDLAPRADELVIAGHTYDKFYGTPLELALRSRGINRVVITGVTTDVCVNCTVLSAANRNFLVTVVTDGVATLDDAIQQACFGIWGRKFARLRTAAEVLAELR